MSPSRYVRGVSSPKELKLTAEEAARDAAKAPLKSLRGTIGPNRYISRLLGVPSILARGARRLRSVCVSGF